MADEKPRPQQPPPPAPPPRDPTKPEWRGRNPPKPKRPPGHDHKRRG